MRHRKQFIFMQKKRCRASRQTKVLPSFVKTKRAQSANTHESFVKMSEFYKGNNAFKAEVADWGGFEPPTP